MKQVKIITVFFLLALTVPLIAQSDVLTKILTEDNDYGSSYGSNCDEPRVGVADPTNQTIINEIRIDNNGVPTVEFNVVVLKEVDERLVFVGPKEFQIYFREGSFFIDDPKEYPGYYQTKNGVIILRVDKKKVEKLGDRAKFKYDVIVNGVVLDPFAVWARDEH